MVRKYIVTSDIIFSSDMVFSTANDSAREQITSVRTYEPPLTWRLKSSGTVVFDVRTVPARFSKCHWSVFAKLAVILWLSRVWRGVAPPTPMAAHRHRNMSLYVSGSPHSLVFGSDQSIYDC